MKADQEIDELIIRATASLKDDQEIHVEVQNELRCHLLDKMDELTTEDLEAEQVTEQAIKSFGSTEEISKDLLSANLLRMKLRSIAKIAIRYCVFPMAVLCFLWTYQLGLSSFSVNTGQHILNIPMVQMGNEFAHLTKDQLFLIKGDLSRKTVAEQQRAIWEKHPESKMYFANYFTHLLSSNDKQDHDHLIVECTLGQKVDPTNVRYDITLAHLYLEKAYEAFGQDQQKLVFPSYEEMAIQLLIKAIKKDSYKSYSKELMKEKNKFLPEVDNFAKNITRISHAAGILLPDLLRFRTITRYLPEYIKSNGDKNIENTKTLMQFWLKSTVWLYKGSCSLIEILVGGACLKVGKDEYLPLYKKYDMSKEHFEMQSFINAFEKEFDYKEGNKADDIKIKKEASILTAMLLPSLDRFGIELTSIDFKSGRWVEYILLEKAVLVGLIFILIICSITCYTISWRWKLSKKFNHTPLLLVPKLSIWLNVIFISIILPIALYYIYTRFTNISGRNYSISYLYYRHALESNLFLALVLFSYWHTIKIHLDNRLTELNIEVPLQSNKVFKYCFIGLIILGIGTVLLTYDRGDTSKTLSIIIGSLLSLMIFLTVCNLLKRFLFPKAEHRMYYSCIARTMAPIFSIGLILISVIAGPYLTKSEYKHLMNDKVIGSSKNVGMTLVEDNLIEDLQKRFTALLQKK